MTTSHETGFDGSYIAAIAARLDENRDTVVLEDDDRTYPGKALQDMLDHLDRALWSQGVRPGDRVALIAPVTATAIAARYAASQIGAVTVFCPGAGTPEQLAVFLSRIAPSHVIVFPETVDAVAAAGASTALSVGAVDGAVNLLAVQPGVDGVHPAVTVDADDDCVMVASGGTTGVSKASIRSVGEYRRLVDLGSNPGRRQLVCTPLAYIAQTMVDATLLGGGTVVLRRSADPGVIIDTVQRRHITHLTLVEPQLVEFAYDDALSDADLSSLIMLTHVGADAAPALRMKLLMRLGSPVLANTYGASEFGLASILAGPDYTLGSPHLATVGRPRPGIGLRVVDDTGTPVGDDQSGFIEVHTPEQAYACSVSPANSGFLPDAWFHTGDVGLIHEGYLQIRGRAGDRRRTARGDRFPVDLQQILCSNPAVRYAVAIPAPAGTDQPFGAAIVLDAGAWEDVLTDLNAHLVARAPEFAGTPIAIVDHVPTTEQGKPDRAVISSIVFPST
ncbi:class I adenylate-forming enzyme family protein [Gordonia sp. L191]|uniref:class I adenylate-forming enzyme family protein n=1 Tax=Gordonia sp. L191 TaxID=2982699 RepID=UPI0024BF7692|nr:class I adenylate-forming enzyme family protein [Gordonia sp. L191]WHU49362.1 class I adenylate-forming enzyme family protein [Gordonia sp. L191]